MNDLRRSGDRAVDGPRELARLLAETIEGEVRAAGVASLVVDGSLDVEGTVAEVERLFADALERGPRAETAEERGEAVA